MTMTRLFVGMILLAGASFGLGTVAPEYYQNSTSFEREVTHVRKADGRITHLCNPLALWSPRSREDVLADIDADLHIYYVEVPIEIEPVDRSSGRYLRTESTPIEDDNLVNLPGC